jgi:hypothetical protein
MQDIVPSVRTGIRIRAVAQEHVCDTGLPEHRDVDQWGITKFIDGVDIRAMLGEKRDTLCESFDSQEVKHSFSVKPTRVDEIRVRGQQTSCALLISDCSVDEFPDERRWQSDHA